MAYEPAERRGRGVMTAGRKQRFSRDNAYGYLPDKLFSVTFVHNIVMYVCTHIYIEIRLSGHPYATDKTLVTISMYSHQSIADADGAMFLPDIVKWL